MATEARPRRMGFALSALLAVLAGCEELPDVPTTASSPALGSSYGGPSPSPTPTPSGYVSGDPAASDPSASGSPRVSPRPSPSLRPSPSPPRPSPTVLRPSIAPPSPSPSPVPSPTTTVSTAPSPSVSPSASPPNPTPAELVFEQPTQTSNFSANALSIRVRADAVTGVTVREMEVSYNGVLLVRQAGANKVLSIPAWSPHVASASNPTPVLNGSHVLTAKVITTAGTETTQTFPFAKPPLFRGWVNRLDRNNGAALSLPPLPQGRTLFHGVGIGQRLFAVHGETDTGSALTNVMMLNLDAPTLLWTERGFPGLLWRARAGYASQGERVFVAGGLINNVASNRVQAFDLLNQVVYDLPNLPTALVAPTLVVHNAQLYVLGGSSTGLAAGAVSTAYRLTLNPNGSFGTTWATARALNLTNTPSQALGRQAAAAVSYGGHIYLLGGEGVAGALDAIWRYDPTLDAWSALGYLPTGAMHLRATVFQDNIWAFGGQTGGSNPIALADAVRITPNNFSVQGFSSGQGGGLPERRSGYGLINWDDPLYGPRLAVVGGHDLGATGAVQPRTSTLLSDSL